MRKNCVVAGTGFYGRAEIIMRYCYDGMNVILKREPDNKHDSNAVAVLAKVPILFGLFGGKNRQIGYIKSSSAKNIARYMDEGGKLFATIESFWAPVKIEHPRVSIKIDDNTGSQPTLG